MITADNITDEQIRELRAEAEAHAYPGCDPVWRDAWNAASDALDADPNVPGRTRAGRARCAEILNARGGK